MKVHLLIIDGQNDFCKPWGSLYVPGADAAMVNLANMIDRTQDKISAIHATLDSHHQIDIAHTTFWKEVATGKNVDPFTIITLADLKAGKYVTAKIQCMPRAMKYVEQLEANGRYPLCVWPVHCDIASEGYAFHKELYEALVRWELEKFDVINKVTKGSNPWTEHYSAVMADVPDPNDPSTFLNTDLIDIMQTADIIPVSGVALDYCVANTMRDIMNNFGEDNIKKFVFLEDCTAAVNAPGLEHLGPDFLKEFEQRGGKIMKSTDFLA